ncbi:hypothetical protein AMK31_23445 [Streptomyces sp. TSRI0107]|nr:hypothetical protein AMK31_23445 [Streptomyces sp. TSRI0107]
MLGHGHWMPWCSSRRAYVIPWWSGERDRSSFQTASASAYFQSCPSRAARSQMMSMSSRASPGGVTALRTRWTRRSLLVVVPSVSAQPAVAGRTTCASSAVLVRKMSCTTRKSRARSRRTASSLSASDCAGFSPTQ